MIFIVFVNNDKTIDFVELEGGRLGMPQQNLLFFFIISCSPLNVMYGTGPHQMKYLKAVALFYKVPICLVFFIGN